MSSKRAECGSIDRFGAEIKISFNKLQYHGSCWGGVFTLLMYGVVLFGVVYYGADLVQRQSPQTTYSQEKVNNPERKVFKADTFSVSFGIEDSPTWNQIIDPTIYSVTAINRKRFKQLNTTSQQYYFQEYILDLQPKVCTLDQFQVSGTQSYYNSLAGIQNMYCLTYPEESAINNSTDPMDLNQVFIEGDYTSDAFSQIEIGFYSCKNKTAAEIAELAQQGKEVITCKPQAEIDLHLQSAYIGMYLTQQIFNPNNYDNPFSNSGADLFWPVSNSLSKYISVFFKNTYLETDQGLVYRDIVTSKGFQLASNSEQMILPVNNQFAYINIRFQKGMQDRIFRTYKSIGQVIAEIGGIVTFMRILGYIFAFPISKFKLRNDVINQLFSFKNEQQQDRQNNKRNNVTFNRFSQSVPSNKGNKQYLTNQNITQISQSPQCKQQSNLQRNYFFSKDSEQFKDPDQFKGSKLNLQNIQKPKQQNNSKNKTIYINDLSKDDSKYDKELPCYSQQEGCSINYLINQDQQARLTSPNDFKYITTPSNFCFNSTSKLAMQEKQQCKRIEPKQDSMMNQNLNYIENKKQEQVAENNSKKQNQKCILNTSSYYEEIFKPKSENIHLSFYEYILYYIFPCTKRIKGKRDKIEFCNQIISEQLDGVYILKKLLELEKLKVLLLSDEQLKLFDYIPKPLIDEDIINCNNSLIPSLQNVSKSSKNTIDKQNPSNQRVGNGNENVTVPSLTIQRSKQNSSSQLLNSNQFTILKVKAKTEEEKSEEAYQAFVQISKKQKLSRKDLKILQMIDPETKLISLQQIDQSTINTDFIQKKSEPSKIVQKIASHDSIEQIELGNLNEAADTKIERVRKSNLNSNNHNKQILKLNQVPNSFQITQDSPENILFPVNYKNQQNNNDENEMNKIPFPEFVSAGIAGGLSSNNDASAGKLYTSQYKLLPIPNLFSLQNKTVSLLNTGQHKDYQKNES